MSGEPDIDAPEENADDLRIQKQHLLAELAMAYQQMEQVMSTAKVERDITYRELRSRNDELQQKLSELEETNDQLREAQKMLVRGERLSAMGQMAAAIVHDLNGPLGVIMGHADLMLLRETEAWRRDELGAICQAVQRLRDLSANMLNLSDKSQAEYQSIDVNELAEEVLTFLSPLTQHAIRSDLGGLCQRLDEDPMQLKGEFVLLVAGNSQAPDAVEPLRLARALLDYLPASQAARAAAKFTGASRRELYAALEAEADDD